MLRHQIGGNSLQFKNPDWVQLTGPNAMEIGKWQLIEVHRDKDDNLQCAVNGRDLTLDEPRTGGDFHFVHLMNDNKNIGQRGDPFAGDLAAFVLYSKELSEQDKKNVRDYFDRIYDFKNAPREAAAAELDTVSQDHPQPQNET